MSCAVCSSPSRRAIDAMLASDSWKSPRRIARMHANISRSQIAHHRKECLLGNPLAVHLLRTGQLSEEEFAKRLRDKGLDEEAVEGVLAAFRRLLEEAS